MCPEALDHYGGGVRDGFELFDLGAKDQIYLWKINVC